MMHMIIKMMHVVNGFWLMMIIYFMANSELIRWMSLNSQPGLASHMSTIPASIKSDCQILVQAPSGLVHGEVDCGTIPALDLQMMHVCHAFSQV